MACGCDETERLTLFDAFELMRWFVGRYGERQAHAILSATACRCKSGRTSAYVVPSCSTLWADPQNPTMCELQGCLWVYIPGLLACSTLTPPEYEACAQAVYEATASWIKDNCHTSAAKPAA